VKDTCSSVNKLLEKYFDQEATQELRSRVEEHLLKCPTCRDALRSMGNLRDLIKIPVEEVVQKEDFQRVWENIRRGIRPQERPAWWETLFPRVDLSFLFQRKVWIPAVAVIVILILITGPVLFKRISSPSDLSVVEYVESPEYNVMVYQSEKEKVTVIWLLEGPGEGEPSSTS
jgi:predicted anti-sigma-YlaC factor YlaD